MSTAIFLTPRGNGGGYDVNLLPPNHHWVGEGYASLLILDQDGRPTEAALSEGDWVQLRDCVDQMLNDR